MSPSTGSRVRRAGSNAWCAKRRSKGSEEGRTISGPRCPGLRASAWLMSCGVKVLGEHEARGCHRHAKGVLSVRKSHGHSPRVASANSIPIRLRFRATVTSYIHGSKRSCGGVRFIAAVGVVSAPATSTLVHRPRRLAKRTSVPLSSQGSSQPADRWPARLPPRKREPLSV